MEISNYSSLFEVFIGFNFAYAGVDSFSKTILLYSYINLSNFIGYKIRLKKFTDDLDKKIAKKYRSPDAINQEERSKYTTLYERVDKLHEELNSITNVDGYEKLKNKLYEKYNSQKFKPLFLLNGIYFVFILIITCSISDKCPICSANNTTTNCNYNYDLISGLILSNVIIIIYIISVSFYRLNKTEYPSVRNFTTFIMVLFLIYLVIISNEHCEYYFPYIYLSIDYMNFNYFVFLFSSCLVMCVPFIFEWISLQSYLNKNIREIIQFDRLENEFNNISLEISQDNESVNQKFDDLSKKISI